MRLSGVNPKPLKSVALGARSDPPAVSEPASAGPRPQASCDLRRMFDDLTREPLPPSLVDLCDQLEAAFRRGDLQRSPAAVRRG